MIPMSFTVTQLIKALGLRSKGPLEIFGENCSALLAPYQRYRDNQRRREGGWQGATPKDFLRKERKCSYIKGFFSLLLYTGKEEVKKNVF